MSMTLVQTYEVGSGGAASIEFTGIPQDGTDLLVLVSGRATNSGGDGVYLRVNSNSSSIYSGRYLRGVGDSTASFSLTSQTSLLMGGLAGTATTANTFNNTAIYLPNYAGSTNKSASSDAVTENNATAAVQYLVAGLAATTSAITSVQLLAGSTNYAEGSTASLYKITKA